MDRTTWSNTWRFVAGLAACLVLGWFAFVRGEPVPLLHLVDLGVHELGHLLTYVFPDLITALAGSAFQVLVPVGLATGFWLGGRDRMAAGLCLAWAASSAQQVAVYVADAPYQRLPLIGGEHDWAFILGRLGILDRAEGVATAVRGLGLALLLAGMVACLWGLARANRTAVTPGPTLEPAGR
ncbi:MAG: hypothetical protein ACRDIZ_08155 [Actinomycetota bacterium]